VSARVPLAATLSTVYTHIHGARAIVGVTRGVGGGGVFRHPSPRFRQPAHDPRRLSADSVFRRRSITHRNGSIYCSACRAAAVPPAQAARRALAAPRAATYYHRGRTADVGGRVAQNGTGEGKK